MIYIEPPEYTYKKIPTSNSDYFRMIRVWELFGSSTEENNFNLAAGIYDTKLISGGSNERRSHAQLYPYRQALHAEQVALMSCRSSVEGSTLYVCRSSDGTANSFLMAKSCYWCMHHLIKEGIAKVVYTTGDVNNPIEAFKISSVEIAPINSLNIDYQLVC